MSLRPLLAPLAPLALALAVGCGDPPTVAGTVEDIWGKPIPDAIVAVAGTSDQLRTDERGGFRMPFKVGPAQVRAGKDGWIAATREIIVPEDGDEQRNLLTIELYPDPPEPGFFGIGHKALEHLEAVPVKELGTDIETVVGLPRVPSLVLPRKDTQRFVYTSTLRSSEIAKIELQLHRLEYQKHVDIAGALGEQQATVDLWVAVEAIPFDLKGLGSKDDYLVETRKKLEPGIYAFHTQHLLDSVEQGRVDKLPREMQVAFPFEIK
jgi:hypothetical protein